MSEVRVERWVLEANLRHCWDDLITTLKRVEELEGDVREGVKAQSHYNDSLVAVQRERDDLKQRVDYCNKNARREITRLREALERAPHGMACGSLHVDEKLGDGKCDCYKEQALEASDE